MKTILSIYVMGLLVCLSACGAQQTAPTIAPAAVTATVTAVAAAASPSATPAVNQAANPVVKTSLGEFKLMAGRFVDEVNGTRPKEGDKVLLITLAGANGERLERASFSLEKFNDMMKNTAGGEVHVAGGDGGYSGCSMAGWVGEKYDEFAIGFMLPANAKGLRLGWPGNAEVDLSSLIR